MAGYESITLVMATRCGRDAGVGCREEARTPVLHSDTPRRTAKPHMSSTNGAAKRLQKSKSAPALKANRGTQEDVAGAMSEDESADSEPDAMTTPPSTSNADVVNEGGISSTFVERASLCRHLDADFVKDLLKGGGRWPRRAGLATTEVKRGIKS